MKIAVFSTKPYDRQFLSDAAKKAGHELTFLDAKLSEATCRLAEGHDAVCIFVNDDASSEVVKKLAEAGVSAMALRCAGFNNVDLDACQNHSVSVVRVPAYSPHAVAEHAVALILSLNRNIHRAYHRIRDNNFAIDGLLGFDLHGKTVGIVGMGKIGIEFAKIMSGFGCRVLAFDKDPSDPARSTGAEFVEWSGLLAQSDIVSLHCPLNPDTHHLIDSEAIGQMKDGVMIVNTSRGGVVDTDAVIKDLKSKKIGHLAIDVYEEEGDVFFEDLSNQVVPDDQLARLTTFPNVLITGHQAFFTTEAMRAIAETTMQNLSDLERDGRCDNEVV